MSAALEHVFTVQVAVAPPLVIGESSRGMRRIIPILGGQVEGPRLRGEVLPGGADWQYVRPDGVLQLTARYTLRADDGALIQVVNRGLRHGPPRGDGAHVSAARRWTPANIISAPRRSSKPRAGRTNGSTRASSSVWPSGNATRPSCASIW